MSDEQPVIISSKVIAYALLGVAYSIKHTNQAHLKPLYKADRETLQALLEGWGK